MTTPCKLRLGSRLLLAMALLPLIGCSISVRQPSNGAFVAVNQTMPTVHVVITGNASYNNLKVTMDGSDVTGQMVSKSSSENDGDLALPRGAHTLTAQADVHCFYCSGQTTHSTATSTFTVESRSGK